MRLIIVILTTAILQVSAAGYAQKVTLKANKQPLENVLRSIRQQTGYDYVADEELLDNAPAVTVNLRNTELDDALKAIFRNQPLTYSMDNKTIILKKSQAATPEIIKPAPANIDITGRVVDENNQPLAGATIRVKNGNGSTITDANGYFTLKQIDPAATINISFIGYTTATYLAKTDLGTIKMIKSTDKLDEVQVVFSGQTTQRLSTGNVTHIGSETISKQPVINVLGAIEGRVPGLFIQQQNGLPGSSFSAQIRGQSSLRNTSNPLIVIDGIPYNPSLLYPGNGNGDTGIGTPSVSGSPLNFINSYDIESVDVLKDADATAIYGSRGANGVILITTKRGKAGELKVSAGVTVGYSKKPKLDFLNTTDYLKMRREAYLNDGVTNLPVNAYDVNGTWDTNSYTDWQDLLVGNTGHYTDAQLSLSGGTNNTQYLVGGSFHRETTIFPSTFPDQMAGLHFNLGSRTNNGKLKVNFSGAFTSNNNKSISADLSNSINLPPDAPAIYNNIGGLNFANSTFNNPLALQPATTKMRTLLSSMNISYEIIPGLNAKTNLGYTFAQFNDNQSRPISIQDPAKSPVNSATFTTGVSNSFLIEPQISYLKVLGRSSLNAIIGATIEQRDLEGNQIYASNYSSDVLLSSPSGANVISASGATNNSQYKYSALYARLNYNYADRYILNLTGRRDGSSRFGPGNQFANFGSIGAAWIFSKESWLDNQKIITFGKIRISYGLTGNDQIGDYSYLNLYNSSSSANPYQGSIGILPTSLNNPDYAWETNKKFEVGIDLGFLQDRINISTDYYRQRSSNQLTAAPLPTFVGPGSVTINLPAVLQNEGLDLTISSVNIRKQNLLWKSTFNFSLNRNQLVDYPGLSSSSLSSRYTIGKPISGTYLFHSVGVNPTTGIYEFVDSQGNLTYKPSATTDKTSFFDSAPRYYGGMENSIQFKGFELSFFLQYTNQIKGDPYFDVDAPGRGLLNVLTPIWNNVWHQPGDQSRYEKLTATTSTLAYQAFSNAASSDYSEIDASYIRLKTLSLSYSLSSRFCSKFHLTSLRVFAEGQNLYTFTGFHRDPEMSTYRTTSLLRTIVTGIQLTL